MRDDRTVNAFDAVVDELFGEAADPRELYDLVSKMNDASEMHVPSAGADAKRKRRQKIVNRTGQGLNALAITAGTHALVMAGRDPHLKKAGEEAKAAKKVTGARIASAPYRTWEGAGKTEAEGLTRVGRALKPAYRHIGAKSPKAIKYAVPLAGGALALHGAEIVGDSIAAHALHNQGKSIDKKEIKKALDDIVRARRNGVISTDTAITMAGDLMDAVSKKQMTDSKQIFDTVDAIAPVIPSKKLQMANMGLQSTRKAANKAKRGLAFARKPPMVPATPQETTEPLPVVKGLDVVWSGEISKRDDEKRQVFGFCTVTHLNGEAVIDRQGDYIPLDEIEKSAYTYVINSRKGGDMHARDGESPLHTSDMIESFVITPEKLEKMGLADDALPHGWWVGFKVNDDAQWERVKKSERTGFSIHGSGKRVEKSL